MENFFEEIRKGLHYNKFELDEILAVEYSCPIPEEEWGIWAQSDHLIHVLSGKKSWRTLHGTVEVTGGDTVYIKKGASFVRQYFDEDFCMLLFFVSDTFIRSTIQELKGKLAFFGTAENTDFHIIKMEESRLLNSYFQSMLHHFENIDKPDHTLLELKFKELLVSILTGNENAKLARYFMDLSSHDLPPLSYIMEQNYCYNLSLEEFARLCHRSLSSFKRDFQDHYGISPGKWLLSKRLDHAAILLLNDAINVSQVAYESGFEDNSHFSRSFKLKFGRSPLAYKNDLIKTRG